MSLTSTINKQAIHCWRESLSRQLDQGQEVDALMKQLTQQVDGWLVDCWQQAGLSAFASLWAVGGYGRGELCLYSDIDLMILLETPLNSQQQQAIEQFLTHGWDTGFELGHSVRTVEDCIQQSRDLTVLTSLLEARCLAGNKQPFAQCYQQLKQHFTPQGFLEAKKQEQHQRHQRFDNTAYNLEPNIKMGLGGLRDWHTLGWVIHYGFGYDQLPQWIEAQWLTAEEAQSLQQAVQFLHQVRFVLHHLAKRREDRLLFDYQRSLANYFGYEQKESQGNQAIEDFMQDYFRAIKHIRSLCEQTLQLAEQRLKPSSLSQRILNERFVVTNGYLCDRLGTVGFERQPMAVMEAFLLSQRQDVMAMSAELQRHLRLSAQGVDFRFNSKVQRYFLTILQSPHNIYAMLLLMNRLGVLANYLPEFADIVGRMQYDLFHTYTVDQHTLFVVRNLQHLQHNEGGRDSRLATLYQGLAKPWLLMIAALYHDIGKGSGQDHSELGARLVRHFGLRHDLAESDIALVEWLVANHLLMSLTAQKQDLDDRRVIADFAAKVRSHTRLNALYLLTVADIRATNPELWNDWRASLLEQLHRRTKNILDSGASAFNASEYIADKQHHAKASAIAQGASGIRVDQLWQRLPADYFLRYSVYDLIWHACALTRATVKPPLVMVRSQHERGGTAIFVYAVDKPAIFLAIAALLERLQLNVLDARLVTSDDGFTLDTFRVVQANGEPIALVQHQDLVAAITRALQNPAKNISKYPIQGEISRRHRHFDSTPFIHWDDDEANGRSLLRLNCGDRPGLLRRIGQVLIDQDIDLHGAKIVTVGERVEDVFFVSSADRQPLSGSNKKQATQWLLEQLC